MDEQTNVTDTHDLMSSIAEIGRKVVDVGYASNRSDAKERGDFYYYTGKPCKRGHLALRFSSTKNCCECKKELDRKWQEENRDWARYKSRQWKRNNLEKHMEHNKRWLENNPEKQAKYAKKWRETHREESLAQSRNKQYARRQQKQGGLSGAQFLKWSSAQVKKCFYCDADCSGDYHVDHLYPLSKGGKHEESNLVISCPACNLRKFNKDPEDFIDEICASGFSASECKK